MSAILDRNLASAVNLLVQRLDKTAMDCTCLALIGYPDGHDATCARTMRLSAYRAFARALVLFDRNPEHFLPSSVLPPTAPAPAAPTEAEHRTHLSTEYDGACHICPEETPNSFIVETVDSVFKALGTFSFGAVLIEGAPAHEENGGTHTMIATTGTVTDLHVAGESTECSVCDDYWRDREGAERYERDLRAFTQRPAPSTSPLGGSLTWLGESDETPDVHAFLHPFDPTCAACVRYDSTPLYPRVEAGAPRPSDDRPDALDYAVSSLGTSTDRVRPLPASEEAPRTYVAPPLSEMSLYERPQAESWNERVESMRAGTPGRKATDAEVRSYASEAGEALHRRINDEDLDTKMDDAREVLKHETREQREARYRAKGIRDVKQSCRELAGELEHLLSDESASPLTEARATEATQRLAESAVKLIRAKADADEEEAAQAEGARQRSASAFGWRNGEYGNGRRSYANPLAFQED